MLHTLTNMKTSVNYPLQVRLFGCLFLRDFPALLFRQLALMKTLIYVLEEIYSL